MTFCMMCPVHSGNPFAPCIVPMLSGGSGTPCRGEWGTCSVRDALVVVWRDRRVKLGAGESHLEHQAYVQSLLSPWGSVSSYPPESGVAQGWPLSYSINQTDQMLAHLQSFSSVPEHFTLPDSTKSGVPLFYIPPGSTTPVSGSDDYYPHFLPTQTCIDTASVAQNHLLFPSLLSLRYLNQNFKL